MGWEEPGGGEAVMRPRFGPHGHESAHAQSPATEQKPWKGSQEGWKRVEIQEDWSVV